MGPRRQSRVDTSELIEEALAASKKYGASSPEARLAWQVVEEIDGSDNNKARVQGLAIRLKQQQPAMAALNNMAAEIEAIKLSALKATPAQENAKLPRSHEQRQATDSSLWRPFVRSQDRMGNCRRNCL